MAEIKPHEVYTTGEAQEILKVSSSTMKRFLKKGLIKANKIGGQYRILGKEILLIVSPKVERRAVHAYQSLKKKIKTKLKNW